MRSFLSRCQYVKIPHIYTHGDSVRERETDHDIHIQPLADMPRDMAVERPDARIIRDDIDDKISRA